MKQFLLYIGCLFCVNLAIAQYTQVPDPNFEQALLDLGIDSEGILDGQFLTADAENIAYLGVQNRNISDLTGIEAFVNLEWLDAFENNISQIDLSLITSPVFWTLRLGNNNLTTIDLSQTPHIVNIGLHNNNITSIDASNLTQAFVLSLANNPLVEIILNNTHLQLLEFQNVLLTTIDLSTVQSLQKVLLQGSQIQSLDFTNNSILEEVRASNTPLESINLPNNPNLKVLDLDNCQLTNLDITHCSGLLDLECYNNLLTNIDLSNNTLLEDVNGNNNLLTNLDVTNNPNIFRLWLANNLIVDNLDFSGNPILEILWLDNNLFTSLDLSQNSILEQVDSNHNPNLEMVNIKNGNNENLFWLAVFNSPNLSCIVVDDPLADNDFILIEANANISLVSSEEECEELSINESTLQDFISVYPNPVQNKLNIASSSFTINAIKIYNVLGSLVFQVINPTSQLDISKVSNGLLFVQIETNKGTIIKKVVKE